MTNIQLSKNAGVKRDIATFKLVIYLFLSRNMYNAPIKGNPYSKGPDNISSPFTIEGLWTKYSG